MSTPPVIFIKQIPAKTVDTNILTDEIMLFCIITPEIGRQYTISNIIYIVYFDCVPQYVNNTAVTWQCYTKSIVLFAICLVNIFFQKESSLRMFYV